MIRKEVCEKLGLVPLKSYACSGEREDSFFVRLNGKDEIKSLSTIEH